MDEILLAQDMLRDVLKQQLIIETDLAKLKRQFNNR
jgi:hypothetical protein